MASPKAFKYWLLALAVPVLAWCYLNKIWVGRFFIGGDNTDFFQLIIYYFQNILKGVYPLWDPYRAWGSVDYLYTQDIGACNPFAQIIPVLIFFGVKAYWAYTFYLVLIWVIGFVGFYFLLNRIYHSPPTAWMGTSLLMFSSGLAVFFSWDLLGLYIFVPLGWFFGFLIGFVKPSSDDHALKRNMLGLCFSCMFITHLYVPFYFLTLFLAFMAGVLLFAGDWMIQLLNAVTRSLRRMPWTVVFCLASLLFSLWPTLDCYLKMKDPQNITEFYRGQNEHKTGSAMIVDQSMIDVGGLPSRTTISEMFSSFETGDDHLSYAPIMLFILALLTLLNRSSRVQRVIFTTGFLLLLITITDACGLQHFLYQHVYVFKLFRNYFFFWILFWACCFVFVTGETKQFLEWEHVPARKYAAWIICVHAGIIVYLMSLEDVPAVSYVTVIASCLWFLARLFAAVRLRPNLFVAGLVFIGLWQPFYVLPFIKGVDHAQVDYTSKAVPFSYRRPYRGMGDENPSLHRKKDFEEESGFGALGFIGQKGAYLLKQNLAPQLLADYVQYKFILYDQTKFMDQQHIDWDAVKEEVSFKDNVVLIDDISGLSLSKAQGSPVIVKSATPSFKVIHFDVNSVELCIHLDERQFLVYNDSFHSGWHVTIDRQPAKLYRANIAFKGVWVEKGDHRVRYYFGSWIDYLRGWGVEALFMLWLFLVIAAFLPKEHDELS